jgi:hypothetical protein
MGPLPKKCWGGGLDPLRSCNLPSRARLGAVADRNPGTVEVDGSDTLREVLLTTPATEYSCAALLLNSVLLPLCTQNPSWSLEWKRERNPGSAPKSTPYWQYPSWWRIEKRKTKVSLFMDLVVKTYESGKSPLPARLTPPRPTNHELTQGSRGSICFITLYRGLQETCRPRSFLLLTFFRFPENGISQLSTSLRRVVLQNSISYNHPCPKPDYLVFPTRVMGTRRGWRRGVAASESRRPGVKCGCSCMPTYTQNE